MLLFLHYTPPLPPSIKIANVLKVYYHTSYKKPVLSGASVASTTQF
jgi:hypothetical protein